MKPQCILLQDKKTFIPAPKTFLLRLISWLTLSMLAIFLTQCKKDDFSGETKGICPEVTLTDPANGATNVVTNKKITITFNEAIDSTTLNATTVLLKEGNNTVAGKITSNGVTAIFTPSVALNANTVYTGTVTTGVKDYAGNAMIANYVWSFNTGNVPTVISTDPANGASNVALSKIITATFSTAMNPLTINTTTFVVKQGATLIPGVVTYTGMTATFTPAAPLVQNSVYAATISTGATDVSGNAMVSNYNWSFATGTDPIVLSTDPANGATSVALNKILKANFSKAMDPLTISGTTFLLKHGVTNVTGNVTYTGTTATFTPSANLLPGTIYTATITTGAKDLLGNAIAGNYDWTFTTSTPTIIPPILGTAVNFGVFGGSAGITNQGINTVINNGSIGTTGASTLVTGFHDGTTGEIYTETPLNVGKVTGRIYTAPPAAGTATSFAIATQGLSDATAAYLSISPASKPGGIDPGAGELGGLTLAPGVYKSASGTFNITNGNLTLDAMGDPNAEWIFQTAAGLTVGVAGPAGARSVVMINGGLPKNVYWYVGSAATINGAGGGVMSGTIIASAGVTFSTAGNATQTVLNGRAISLSASVTLVNTTINVQ